MSELVTVARPYARALYDLAEEQGRLGNFQEQLATLAAVSLHPRVKLLLESPKLDKQRKLEVLSQLMGDDLDPILDNFLVVLIDNNRVGLIDTVYQAYREMMLAVEKIEQAKVYSAYQLSDDEFNHLVQSIEARCGVRLAAQLLVEPELIGGFKVEFGDQVLDMSVKSELDALYQTMIS